MVLCNVLCPYPELSNPYLTCNSLNFSVKEARKAAQSGQGPPVLYLNAGDTYTGTAWFTIYKWKIAAEFVNALQPDAVVSTKIMKTKERFIGFLSVNVIITFFSFVNYSCRVRSVRRFFCKTLIFINVLDIHYV